MLQKVNIRATIITALIAAVLFCVPAAIYISKASYRATWLLYLGSFLFFITIWVHTMMDSHRRKDNESTVALVFASHVATIAGIVLCCITCFILLTLMVPGYLQPGTPGKVLTGEPANSLVDKTDGLSFDIFFAATFINFSVGSFTGIVLPFALKRNQTRDRRRPTPFHHKGVK
jgi:amino acid transporter